MVGTAAAWACGHTGEGFFPFLSIRFSLAVSRFHSWQEPVARGQQSLPASLLSLVQSQEFCPKLGLLPGATTGGGDVVSNAIGIPMGTSQTFGPLPPSEVFPPGACDELGPLQLPWYFPVPADAGGEEEKETAPGCAGLGEARLCPLTQMPFPLPPCPRLPAPPAAALESPRVRGSER